MRISAITLNGVNGYNVFPVAQNRRRDSISLDNFKNIDNLSFIPSYQIPFTSIQNSSKLRALFKYNLPCIYSGVPMIDPKQVSRLIKSGAFEKPSKDVAEILSKYNECYSGMEARIMDIISTEDTILDEIYFKSLNKKMYRFINEIKDERDKTIIILRYGLNNQPPLTQREVSKKLGISRSYVSRIEKRVLGELRQKFGSEDYIR